MPSAKPIVYAEVAWGTDPLTRPADVAFSDLGTGGVKIQSLETKRGGRVKTGDIEPGTATAVLDTPNRVLEPGNATSPWSPNVDLRKRIRFFIKPAGQTRRVIWTGFIKRLPTAWTLGTVKSNLQAVGLLSLIANEQLPPSALHAEIVDDGPTNYWPLGETAGDRSDDVVGVADGTWHAPVSSSSPGPPWDPRPAQLLSHGTADLRLSGQSMTTGPVEFPGTFSLELWFRYEGGGEGNLYDLPIFVAYNGATKQVNLYIDSVERVFYIELGTRVFKQLTDGAIGLLDGRWHHVLFEYNATTDYAYCYIDGLNKDFGGVAGGSFGGSFTATQVSIGPVETADEDDAWKPEVFSVSHVALYDSNVGQGLGVSHYAAGVDAWASESTGVRLARILDLAGVASGDRDIDPGTQACGPTMLNSQKVGEYIAKIAKTEGGPIFETADGKIALRERVANDPAIDLIFSDLPSTDGGAPYEPVQADYSTDRLINIAEVNREGGDTQRSENTPSVAAYGPSPLQLDTLHGSPSAARSTGARLVIRNGSPRYVIDGITVSSRHATEVPIATSLDSEVGMVATLKARPPGTGGTLTQTTVVESIEQKLNGDGSWKTAFGIVEHTTLPDFWWDEPGQGWDESAWVA